MSDREQRNKNRKTVADVLADFRQYVENTKLPSEVAETIVCYLDRIKAAAKRERETIEADSLAVGGIVEAARHKPVVNAAAKKHRRTKVDDSKILQDYWRDHYEV